MPAPSLPLTPDSDEAGQWARDELSRGVYSDSPSLWEWLWEKIVDLIDKIVTASSGLDSIFLPLIILAVVAAVVILALVFSGPVRRRRRSQPVRVGGVWQGDDARSSAQLRAAATDAAAVGDFTLAAIEQFRAIVRRLEEHSVVEATTGMTAVEVAATAGTEMPGFAEQLRAGAGLFNESLYGTRPATQAQFTDLRRLADALESAHSAPPERVGSR